MAASNTLRGNTLRGKTLRGKTLILAAPGDSFSPAVLQRSSNRLLGAGAVAQASVTAAATLAPYSLVQVQAFAGNGPVAFPASAAVGNLLVVANYNNTATPPVTKFDWTTAVSLAGTALSGAVSTHVITAQTKNSSFRYFNHAQGIGFGPPATSGTRIVVPIEGNKSIYSDNGGVTWSNGTFNDTAITMRPIAYGNGIYLAFNNNTAAASSSANGTSWTARTLPIAASWFDVVFGGGKFVCVANGSTDVLSTTDGINYTYATFPGSIGGVGIAYGNGIYVAIAEYIQASGYSSDGVTWTAMNTPSIGGGNWMGIAFGNGKFVIVGQNGQISTSTDGFTWTSIITPFAMTPSIGGISFGDGMFIAHNAQFWMTSPDGVTWTKRGEAAPTYAASWRFSKYCDNQFIMVGDSGGVATSGWLHGRDVTYLSGMAYDNFNTAGPIGAVASTGGTGLTATVPALTLLQTPKRPFVTSFLGYAATNIVFPNPSTGTAPLAYRQAQANGAAGSSAVYDTAGSVA